MMKELIRNWGLKPEDRDCSNCKDYDVCCYDHEPRIDPVRHVCYGHIHEKDLDLRDKGNYDLFLKFIETDWEAKE